MLSEKITQPLRYFYTNARKQKKTLLFFVIKRSSRKGEELKQPQITLFINTIELLRRYAPAPLCRKRSRNNAFNNLNTNRKKRSSLSKEERQ